jgi:serine protease
MKKRFYIIIGGILAIASMSISNTYAGTPNGRSQEKVHKIAPGAEYLSNKVIVKFKQEYRPFVTLNGISHPLFAAVSTNIGLVSQVKKFKTATPPAEKFNAFGLKMVDLSLIYELEISKVSVEKALAVLTATGLFEYVEPHYIYKSTYVPNDPDTSASKSYYFNNIKAYQAWDINKGSTSVVIGITDSGIDIDHPDLVDNLYINTADPINGIDDDNDGYIDNNIGWDLGGADFNNVVEDNDPNIKGSNNSHGSHVSGCASASTDNGIGVSGVGFKSKILPIKCSADNDTRSNGSGFIIAGYEGIAYAADHGAHIINCSWGGPGGGSFGQDIIDYASINKNCLVVAAAGNDGSEVEQYPCDYNYVLNVASSSSSDRKSNFSNYSYNVDVMAPGSAIYSTLYNNSYNFLSGTSMASPIVAGAAAIVKAQYPNYTGLQVGELLRVTADNVDNINQASIRGKIGTGRINMLRALTETGKPALRIGNLQITDNNNGSLLPGDTINIVLDFTNYLSATQNLVATITSNTTSKAKVVQGTANMGVINTAETKNNTSAPFRIALTTSVQESEVLSFKVTLTDAATGYSGVEYFTIVANLTSLNVLTNRIGSTVTSNARVGFNNGDATGGLGFTFDGKQLIYELSLMAGNSASRIVNNARGATATPDDEFGTKVRINTYPSTQADFHAKALMDDSKDASPYGLEVIQKTYAWNEIGEDQYFIQVLKLVNTSSSDINNFYIGYFGDYDIGDATKNSTGYDFSRNLGYVYDLDSGGAFGAIKGLSQNLDATFHSSSNNSNPGGVNQGDGYSDAEKFTCISTANGPVITAKEDVMITVGQGPFDIKAGDTVRVGFAFIGGSSLADIQAAADKAQIKYNGLQDDADVDTMVVSVNTPNIESLSIFPNPAQQFIQINGSLAQEDNLQVFIYAINGQLIDQIDLGKQGKAIQSSISIAHLAQGVYNVVLKGTHSSASTKVLKN